VALEAGGAVAVEAGFFGKHGFKVDQRSGGGVRFLDGA
jgi:hypothetical protein